MNPMHSADPTLRMGLPVEGRMRGNESKEATHDFALHEPRAISSRSAHKTLVWTGQTSRRCGVVFYPSQEVAAPVQFLGILTIY